MTYAKAIYKKSKKGNGPCCENIKVMHHNYIGTEHILVGLLRERTGVAAKVLLDAGIEEEKLTELIEDLIAPSASVAVLDPDGYSPRTEKVLENADKEPSVFIAGSWDGTPPDRTDQGDRTARRCVCSIHWG